MKTDLNSNRAIASQPDMMFGPLVTPHHLATDSAGAEIRRYSSLEISSLMSMASFMTSVLPRPHDDLGRSGAVCPFAAGSLRRDMMSLTACRLGEIDDDALLHVMDALRKFFIKSMTAQDGEEIYRSITVVFPHLVQDEGSALIDRAQKALKPCYIAEGLMIGEFYPECPAPGLYNTAFRPFQAPVVSLSIRHMTVLDAPFIIDDDRHLSAFLKRFGGGGERYVSRSVADRNCPQIAARVQAFVALRAQALEANA